MLQILGVEVVLLHLLLQLNLPPLALLLNRSQVLLRRSRRQALALLWNSGRLTVLLRILALLLRTLALLLRILAQALLQILAQVLLRILALLLRILA